MVSGMQVIAYKKYNNIISSIYLVLILQEGRLYLRFCVCVCVCVCVVMKYGSLAYGVYPRCHP